MRRLRTLARSPAPGRPEPEKEDEKQPVRRAVAAAGIWPKLAVSQPDDPLEREADAVADRVTGQSTGDCCAGCAAGKGCSGEPKVHRAAAGPAQGLLPVNLALGTGQPLDQPARDFFEPRLGRDLGAVRVHTGPDAASAAGQVAAKAFTSGTDIAFGAGMYSPGTEHGRRLIAHELAHVVQGTGDVIHRKPMDPANTHTWDWYDSEEHRKKYDYLGTLNAAPGAAQAAAASFENQAPPATDEERAAFEKRALTLVRLTALSQVGEHRRALEARKADFLAMVSAAQAGPEAESKAGGTSTTSKDLAAAVRAAAKAATELGELKKTLTGLRDTARRAVRVNGGPDTLPAEMQTLWDSAQPHSAPDVLPRVLMARHQMTAPGLSWGSKKVVLMDLGRDLGKLRERQIGGTDAALGLVYRDFPFLAELKASWILTGKSHAGTAATAGKGLAASAITLPVLAPVAGYLLHYAYKADVMPGEQALFAAVTSSFDKLLGNTDEAILKIGSGSIHPLDLPGAVAATRGRMPAALKAAFDQLSKDREVAKFAVEMVMALGIAVLTGLTGGLAGLGFAAAAAATGAVAAGAGAVQVGEQFKSMMDRQVLSSAAANPEKTLLGVGAPGMFEWTMLGIAAVLTAVDLATVARQLGGLRPAFHEPPKLPATARPGEPVPPKAPAPAAAVEAAEARVLQAGKGPVAPTAQQVDAELAIVQRSQTAKSTVPGYDVEVRLPNEHVWRRGPNGSWCRFSNGRICVPGMPGKSAAEAIKSPADIAKYLDPHMPDITKPPPGLTTADDLLMWERYNLYYRERVVSIRDDLAATGRTSRDFPRDFENFRSTFDKKLWAAREGKLVQGVTAGVLSDIAAESGAVLQNVGVSRIPNPGVGQVHYLDHFLPRTNVRATGVSGKNYDFTGKTTRAQLEPVVQRDIDEAMLKYHGKVYFRRPGYELSGQPIIVDEIVINYSSLGLTAAQKQELVAIGKDYAAFKGADVKIGFFDYTKPAVP
ncbi:DUF4157 domain-containing protein [Longispora albida]|uniref:eCIS core domain-containing protein n=1 Tax=Longispora albida TaxID=203523 RepID=UPI00036D54FD|nr:DUF4157 domain-containing protein [Longispora albida]